MCSQHAVGLFLLGGAVFHTVSLLSSSFVEEEHQTWYFLTVTVCLLIGLEHWRQSVLKTSDIPPTSVTPQDATGRQETRLSVGDTAYREISTRHRGMTEERRIHVDDRRETHAGDATGEGVVVCLCSLAGVLVSCRIARTWNQTGDKWSHLPDIGDWLVR